MASDQYIAFHWHRIDTWLQANTPEVYASLQSGATDVQIQEAEAILGIALPDDVRASYKIHNGIRDNLISKQNGQGLLDSYKFYSLDEIVEDWQMWKRLLDDGTFSDSISDPGTGIKSGWWNSKWIPVALSNDTGDCTCSDLDPGIGGVAGQIIFVSHDTPDRSVIAKSFAEWLASFADDLEAGDYTLSDDYYGLVHYDDL